MPVQTSKKGGVEHPELAEANGNYQTPVARPSRSVAATQSGRHSTITFDLDDDLDEVFESQDQRSARRKKRFSTVPSSEVIADELSLPERRKSLSTRGPLELAIAALTEQQKQEQYEICMKAYAGNKVTTKNAFGLHLIECLPDMVEDTDKDGQYDFQKVSLALQASSKIYGARVDALHADAIDICASMYSKKKATVADKDGAQGEDELESNGGIRPRKPKKQKKFLVSRETITLTPGKLAVNRKPHLRYDEILTSVDPSQINHLMYYNDICELHPRILLDAAYPTYVDPTVAADTCAESTEDIVFPPWLSNSAPNYFKKAAMAAFCQALRFSAEKWPVIDEDSLPNVPSAFETGDMSDNEAPFASDSHEIPSMPLDNDDLPSMAEFSMHHENDDVINDCVINQCDLMPNEMINGQMLEPHVLDFHNSCSNMTTAPLGYNCLDPEFLASAHAIQDQVLAENNSQQPEKPKRRLTRKEPVNFDCEESDYSRKFLAGTRTALSQKTLKLMAAGKDNLIPDEYYDESDLGTYMVADQIPSVNFAASAWSKDFSFNCGSDDQECDDNDQGEDMMSVSRVRENENGVPDYCDDDQGPNDDDQAPEEMSTHLKTDRVSFQKENRIDHDKLVKEVRYELLNEDQTGDASSEPNLFSTVVANVGTKFPTNVFGKKFIALSFVSMLKIASVQALHLEPLGNLLDVKIYGPSI